MFPGGAELRLFTIGRTLSRTFTDLRVVTDGRWLAAATEMAGRWLGCTTRTATATPRSGMSTRPMTSARS